MRVDQNPRPLNVEHLLRQLAAAKLLLSADPSVAIYAGVRFQRTAGSDRATVLTLADVLPAISPKRPERATVRPC